jgi:hypothetical protein
MIGRIGHKHAWHALYIYPEVEVIFKHSDEQILYPSRRGAASWCKDQSTRYPKGKSVRTPI